MHTSFTILEPELRKVDPRYQDFGYVEFVIRDDALKVLNHPIHYLNNKPVTVEIHKNGTNNDETCHFNFKKIREKEAPLPKAQQSAFDCLKNPKKGWQGLCSTYSNDACQLYKENREFFQHEKSHIGKNKDTHYAETYISSKRYEGKETKRNLIFPAPELLENSEPIGFSQYQKSKPSLCMNLSKPRRPFKTFYKNLKRTHVQKRLASRSFNEENYVYRREPERDMTNRLDMQQIAGLDP